MSEHVKTIYRVIKNRNFTQISNDILHNPKLTMKAKGLMCIMLSLPDTWDFHRDHLVTLSADGKDSLKAAIKELQIAGHLSISNERDERGRITQWVMEVHEIPTTLAPQQVYPEVAFPQVGNPQVVNPPFSNTNPESKTKENNNRAVVDKLFDSGNGLVPWLILSELLDKYGEERVREQLTNLRHSNGIHNPPAWLRLAIENNYKAAPTMNTPALAPSSYEDWSEKLQSKRNAEREKLMDPNDWREKALKAQLEKLQTK